jgi:hypothetical protein
MVTPEKMMSIGCQHVLRDMVEFQMYLLAQPQRAAWPMLPRNTKTRPSGKGPRSSPIELSEAQELLDQGFIEPSSNRTFVVSRSGYEFYKREFAQFTLIPAC